MSAPFPRLTVALFVLALTFPVGDFHSPQEHREQIVAMIKLHALVENQWGDVAVPTDMGDATTWGAAVWVQRDPALTVFFTTKVFFSPDPYCGYEYAEGALVIDPLGSGMGVETDPLGGDWYWICAT